MNMPRLTWFLAGMAAPIVLYGAISLLQAVVVWLST